MQALLLTRLSSTSTKPHHLFTDEQSQTASPLSCSRYIINVASYKNGVGYRPGTTSTAGASPSSTTSASWNNPPRTNPQQMDSRNHPRLSSLPKRFTQPTCEETFAEEAMYSTAKEPSHHTVCPYKWEHLPPQLATTWTTSCIPLAGQNWASSSAPYGASATSSYNWHDH